MEKDSTIAIGDCPLINQKPFALVEPSIESLAFDDNRRLSMPDKLKLIIRDTWPQLSRPHATVGKAEKFDEKLRRFYFG